jgi:pyridoxine/pyridoxamine 5'-phosphate oxidase
MSSRMTSPVEGPDDAVVASRAALEMQVQDSLRRYPGGADVPHPRRWGGFRVLPSRVESSSSSISRTRRRSVIGPV